MTSLPRSIFRESRLAVAHLMGALLAASCTPTHPSAAATQRTEAKANVETPSAPEQSLPLPLLEPVSVDGDCTTGPPMGELGVYAATSVKLATTDARWVRVRSCAVWPVADQRNVIGTLDAGLVVPAFGPVKHGPVRSGIGYVVPLVDASGRTCRGYVSGTVLERVDAREEPNVGQFLPLPDAQAAWRGPCFPTGNAPD